MVLTMEISFKETVFCRTWASRRSVVEAFAFLGCYAEWVDK
jgi:hypothetical protein